MDLQFKNGQSPYWKRHESRRGKQQALVHLEVGSEHNKCGCSTHILFSVQSRFLPKEWCTHIQDGSSFELKLSGILLLEYTQKNVPMDVLNPFELTKNVNHLKYKQFLQARCFVHVVQALQMSLR